MLTRRTPAAATTLDRAARTVEAVLSTGSPVRRPGPAPNGSWGVWIEKLDLSTVDPASLVGRPILRDHENRIDSIVGRIEAARLERGALVAKIKFMPGPDGDRLIDSIEGGFVSGISIGYSVETWKVER
jgi:hypothetical protein